MGRLSGRSAIVTGGARGIGAHYCRAFAAEGARVMIADIADGHKLVEDITAQHGRDVAASQLCDVSNEAAVRSLVEQTLERFGSIDILVNNAALLTQLPLVACTQIDVDEWDRVASVNVRGAFLMVKHVAPHMMARGYGKIINIGSGTAYKGAPQMLHYVTSKGAITAMTRALSRELGEHGIRVNTLAPGLILSDTMVANEAHVAMARPWVLQSRALRRDGYPEDLIGALIFLASGDSDFVTGQTIAVDGGSINT